ncbi:hypothetical protein ACU686_41020 [Yinghuangia aomiensis]
MTTWFRAYGEDEDLWRYFEADEEDWASRTSRSGGRMGVRWRRPRWGRFCSCATRPTWPRWAAVNSGSASWRKAAWRAGQGLPQAAEIAVEEFERLWAGARQALDGSA